jgi:hypothetical protein
MEKHVFLLYVCKSLNVVLAVKFTVKFTVAADHSPKCSLPSGLASQHGQTISLLRQA